MKQPPIYPDKDYFTKFDLELTNVSVCAREEYQGDKIQIWIVFQDFDIALG